MGTLSENLGGEAAVDKAVDIFYRKVLSDDRVNGFCNDVDMDKQAARQKAFLTMVFGGPNSDSGVDMQEGHKHVIARGLNDSHVDAIIADGRHRCRSNADQAGDDGRQTAPVTSRYETEAGN